MPIILHALRTIMQAHHAKMKNAASVDELIAILMEERRVVGAVIDRLAEEDKKTGAP